MSEKYSAIVERKVVIAEDYRTGRTLLHACEQAARELGMDQKENEVESDKYFLLSGNRRVVTKTTRYLHTNMILTRKDGFLLELLKLQKGNATQSEMVIKYSESIEKLVEEYLGLVAKKLGDKI